MLLLLPVLNLTPAMLKIVSVNVLGEGRGSYLVSSLSCTLKCFSCYTSPLNAYVLHSYQPKIDANYAVLSLTPIFWLSYVTCNLIIYITNDFSLFANIWFERVLQVVRTVPQESAYFPQQYQVHTAAKLLRRGRSTKGQRVLKTKTVIYSAVSGMMKVMTLNWKYWRGRFFWERCLNYLWNWKKQELEMLEHHML